MCGQVKSLSLPAFFAALAITAIAASAAPAPSPPAKTKLTKWQQAEQERFKNSAPADEYFGRMKMSFLGMNNTFRDSSISSGDHTTNQGIINKVALAEDALEDWARRYPRDPQLARTYFLAVQVERKIWVKANQERAWIYLNRLVQMFPDSYFGKTLKRDIAIGFTEHYYSLPVPCATPAAASTATPDATAADQTAPDASTATDTPSRTPPPTPSPSPGPTQTTIAKGLRAQIIPQACVPPPTPSPSPSPTPSPSPSPSPAASGTPAAPPDVPSASPTPT